MKSILLTAISTAFLSMGALAHAGGAEAYPCSSHHVALEMNGQPATVSLVISMGAQLAVNGRLGEICQNAFKGDAWDRFICNFNGQSVLVTVDSRTCIIY